MDISEKYYLYKLDINSIPERCMETLYVPTLSPLCRQGEKFKWYSLYLAPLLYYPDFNQVAIFLGF